MQWAIQINKIEIAGGVVVGICLKNKVDADTYYFSKFREIGHATYLLGGTGCSFSHSNQAFNFVFKGFKYGANDRVWMGYDADRHKLYFTKNNGPDHFELDIEPPP